MIDPEGRAEPQSKPNDIDELGQKLDRINAKRNPIEDPTQNSASNMAEGLKYASEFSAAVLVGAALGWGVDKLTGCLLYTSPSPRDGLLSRMPSSA